MRRKRDRQQPLDLSELQASYRAACDADDYDRQVEILGAMTTSYPDISWPWYDLGLRMKWRRDWPASRAANQRALALLDSTTGADGPDGPINDDFGMTPIRLNPDPRFAEPLFTLNRVRHGICSARPAAKAPIDAVHDYPPACRRSTTA